MRLWIFLEVDVELPVWQAEYGLRGDEVVADIERHVPDLINDAVDARARAMGGTFRLRRFPVVDGTEVGVHEEQWLEATSRWERRVTGTAR